VVSVDAFLISDGSSFQSRGAVTLNARSSSLSLVHGTTWSPLHHCNKQTSLPFNRKRTTRK